jgi:cytochrome c biogenesis factor
VADANAPARTVHPQVRTYDKDPDQQKREVALDGTLLRDLYIVLAGFTPADQTAVLEVTINPLVAWVWIGAMVGVLGGTICLLPSLQPRTNRVPAPESKPNPTACRARRPVVPTGAAS